MNKNQHIFTSIMILAAFALILIGGLGALGQESPASSQQTSDNCGIQLESFYVSASQACIARPDNHICNGGAAPNVEPTGPVSNSVGQFGALVPINVLQSVAAQPFAVDGNSGGLLWFRAEEQGYRALLVGDVAIRDFPVPNFPVWQNMIVSTSPTPAACGSFPRNMLILQNRSSGEIASFGVNGVSMVLDGTAVIQTEAEQTYFIVVEGVLRIIANGQSQFLVAGEQATTSYPPGEFTRPIGGPSLALPFDPLRLSNLPSSLLDRTLIVPQPGYVTTQGAVNLRTAPTTDAGVILQIPAGVVMSVLGANPAGDWYHVELPSGLTGWMFAELLRKTGGEVTRTYEATPSLPQRYGRIGQTAEVLVSTGANLRTQPYVIYDTIAVAPLGTEVELVARSPYGPWVKVNAGGIEGWVSLVALETRAVIEALPYDNNVVPPPEPTLVPGTTGNAFPDPSCWPNC